MLLQRNEPAAGQHAFHFHLHVYPKYDRFEKDNSVTKIKTTPEERKEYINTLKRAITTLENTQKQNVYF